ncbi:MAG: GntR family transcriptional regulator [Thermodesulfobacteriota bacterium]
MDFIDKGSRDPTPKYYRLQTLVREQIESGKWGPGEAIPTEEELASTHGLSLNTVRKAIINLVSEGYLHRRQGKGTFVSGSTIRRENLRSYRMLREFDRDEAGLRIRFLELGRTGGSENIRRRLKTRATQDLYEVKRLFLCQDRPLVYTDSYLPANLFKGLEKIAPEEWEKKSLYILLEDRYGVTTVVQRELFSVRRAEGALCEALHVKPGFPLLVIDMVALTYKERPCEYRISYCLTDTHRVYREK